MTEGQPHLQHMRDTRSFPEVEAVSVGFLWDLAPVDLECRSVLSQTLWMAKHH